MFVIVVVGTVVGVGLFISLAIRKATNDGEGQVTLFSSLEDRVAVDFEKQYFIAQRQGDKMQVCVQAGVVASGLLTGTQRRQI